MTIWQNSGKCLEDETLEILKRNGVSVDTLLQVYFLSALKGLKLNRRGFLILTSRRTVKSPPDELLIFVRSTDL